MNRLPLRRTTPLALFPALAAPQDFTAGYCSCQWGREKGMFAQTRTNSFRLRHARAHFYTWNPWEMQKKHFQEPAKNTPACFYSTKNNKSAPSWALPADLLGACHCLSMPVFSRLQSPPVSCTVCTFTNKEILTLLRHMIHMPVSSSFYFHVFLVSRVTSTLM